MIPTLSLVDSALNPLMALGSVIRTEGHRTSLETTIRAGSITPEERFRRICGRGLRLFLGGRSHMAQYGSYSGDAFDALTADLSMLVMVLQTLRIGVVGHTLRIDRNPRGRTCPVPWDGVSASPLSFSSRLIPTQT